MNAPAILNRVAPPRKVLSYNVLVLRALRGFSQAVLADAAGVARLTISRLESGASDNVTIGTLERIADALGTTVVELLTPVQPRQLTDAELARRAGSADEFVTAGALHTALEGQEPPRYSRAGRRRVGSNKISNRIQNGFPKKAVH